MHRDVKPENILVDKTNPVAPVLKVRPWVAGYSVKGGRGRGEEVERGIDRATEPEPERERIARKGKAASLRITPALPLKQQPSSQ